MPPYAIHINTWHGQIGNPRMQPPHGHMQETHSQARAQDQKGTCLLVCDVVGVR